MTDDRELQEAKVEAALLRGELYLTASALRGYHDAPHFEIDDDGIPKFEVIVTEITRSKAGEALARAEKMLKVYTGRRTDHGVTVDVEDNGQHRGLDPRFDLRSHSPMGQS